MSHSSRSQGATRSPAGGGPARSRARLSLLLGILLLGCQSQPSQAAPTPDPSRAPAEQPTVTTVVEPTSLPSLVAATTASATVAPVGVQPTAAPPTAAPAETVASGPAPAPLAQGPVQSFSGQRAHQDVQYLAGEIGSRVTGSSTQARALDYLRAQLEAVGLPTERETFPFSGYDDRGSTVEVLAPQPFSPAAQTLVFSPPGEIEAEMVYVGLGRADDFDPAAVNGKVALARRGEIRFGEKVANLAAAGARGVVIFNQEPGTFAGNLGARGQVPAASLSREDGERLLALLERGPTTVRLKVDADVRERSGTNLVATRAGGPQTVVIGGHFDSVRAGPGANDNASGTATMLELARVVAGRQYPFTVRFVAFDTEEIGLVGSAYHVRAMDEAERSSIAAMINLDMVGVGERVSFGGDSQLVQRAIGLAGEIGVAAGQMRGGAGSSSDHASFMAAGIPSLFIYRGEDPNYHTPEDKPEFVRPEHLEFAGRLVLAMLDQLAANGS